MRRINQYSPHGLLYCLAHLVCTVNIDLAAKVPLVAPYKGEFVFISIRYPLRDITINNTCSDVGLWDI